MKESLTIIALVTAASIATSMSQSRLPRSVKQADRNTLNDQTSSFVEQISPLVKEVGKNVVSIQFRGKQLAYGTVTEHGIITKWSEISKVWPKVKVVLSDGNSYPVKPLGVYEKFDLVLLSNETKLKGVKFDDVSTKSTIGDFLVLSGVKSQPAGFGVVSVNERSLLESDKAFLGIQMNFQDVSKGVLIDKVVVGSGAFQAGLKQGDYLQAIDKVKLASPLQTRATIVRLKPGQKIKLHITRSGQPQVLDVLLGSREQAKGFPRRRLNRMETMGGAISKVRTGFPSVIQSDMQVAKNQMGAPVVNLDGKVVGVSLSRSRIKTHIVPAQALNRILATAPSKDAIAKRPQIKIPLSPRNTTDVFELHRKQLKDMQRRMDQLQLEMKQFEREMSK